MLMEKSIGFEISQNWCMVWFCFVWPHCSTRNLQIYKLFISRMIFYFLHLRTLPPPVVMPIHFVLRWWWCHTLYKWAMSIHRAFDSNLRYVEIEWHHWIEWFNEHPHQNLIKFGFSCSSKNVSSLILFNPYLFICCEA